MIHKAFDDGYLRIAGPCKAAVAKKDPDTKYRLKGEISRGKRKRSLRYLGFRLPIDCENSVSTAVSVQVF